MDRAGIRFRQIVDRLRRPCKCGKNASDGRTCFTHFLQVGFDAFREYSLAFHQLHKLDQDKALFDTLRDLALSQGVLQLGEAPMPGKTLRYRSLGRDVCRDAFAKLLGVAWWPQALWNFACSA